MISDRMSSTFRDPKEFDKAAQVYNTTLILDIGNY